MYELLKTLKEVGFPQPDLIKDVCEDCSYFHWWDDENICWNSQENWPSEEGWVYEPTTDELIEELGDKFLNVHVSGKEYGAFGDNGTEDVAMTKGSTPKEALIRLYIALNKK